MDIGEVDVVTNLEDGLTFLPDNSIDVIYSKSVFEHIRNFDFLMKEMHRVPKPAGRIECYVPHFSNPYFYSDPTHVRFFGLYTFYYYANKESVSKLIRKIPEFYDNSRYLIDNLELDFRCDYPVIKHFYNLFQKFVNKSLSRQEFYEYLLSPIIPCYGIRAILRPCKSIKKGRNFESICYPGSIFFVRS